MKETNVALKWYRPAEIEVLKSWLVWGVAVNLFVLGGESLRGDPASIQLTTWGSAALLLARLLLPDAIHVFKYWFCLAASLAALLLGFAALVNSQGSLYDIWSRAWLILPSAMALGSLLRPETLRWSLNQLDGIGAQSGLARNRRMTPLLESIGTHSMLLHGVALVVVPVVWILDVAVSPGNALGGAIGDAFTWEHFIAITQGESFWLWTRNSLTVSLGTTLLGLSFAVPAGYAFSRFNFSGRKPAMFSFMLIQMFPGVIILVPYFMVMKTLGLLNTSLGLILAYSVTALPLCVWMLKGFFDTVPRELEEAALLDGCSQVQVFRKIVLPLSLPALGVTALFSFLAAWNEYLLAMVFNTSSDKYTLPVGLASMIPANNQLWGDFAAASVLVSIPVVVLFVLFQKSLVQGLTLGGVKG